MHKIAPLVSLAVATIFVSYSAIQFATVSGTITQKEAPTPLVGASPPQKRPNAPQAAQGSAEPAYKSVIRCLGDMDDLLDKVHDAASFATVKPKLLSRARQQADLASQHPNQGMAKLSKSAALEMQKAVNRHTESLTRAIQAVPAVQGFFEKDIAAILSGK